MRFLSAVTLLLLILHPFPPSAPEGFVDDERIVLLIQRIDAYNSLFMNREYGSAYEMLQAKDREGRKDKKEWIRAGKQLDNGLRISDWEVNRIWIDGLRAKVEIEINGEMKTRSRQWEAFSEIDTDYWVFEDGNWFYIPGKLRDWREGQETEVSVPSPAGTARIRKAD